MGSLQYDAFVPALPLTLSAGICWTSVLQVGYVHFYMVHSADCLYML